MGNGKSSHSSKYPAGTKNITHKTQNYRMYMDEADVDKYHGKATQTFESAIRGTDMFDAIESYTGSGYRHTNPMMRDSRYANMTTEETFNDLERRALAGEVSYSVYEEAYNIHRGLSLGESTDAFVGYRGADYRLLNLPSNATMQDLKALEGTLVRDGGNMSISMISGREFGGSVKYEVHVPKGKGIGANIMGVSIYDSSEGEFLFNNGAVFRISKVTTKNGKPYVIMNYIGRN